MKRQELISSHPLRFISPSEGGMVPGRHLALVSGPAGTGKTAILVQIALDKLLRGERVVHIGINDHLNNIKLWYSQVFAALARKVNLAEPAKLDNEIMGHRLLMTFMADTFSPQRLIQRLEALSRHDIPLPDCLVIDGLNVQIAGNKEMLAKLHSYAQENNITIWLSCLDMSAEAEKQADTVLALKTSPDGSLSLEVVCDASGYAPVGASISLDPQTLTLSS